MRRVLRFPPAGRLLVATDLQGNLRDFERMFHLFEEARSGGEAYLLFTGDLVHGPRLRKEEWPDFLGDFYREESPALIQRFQEVAAMHPGRVFSILGNHEHAHIGGPHTAKFHLDEVLLLELELGVERALATRDLFRTFPLIAIAPCGIVFTHGAPAARITEVAEVEAVRYDGFEMSETVDMIGVPVLGPLLWARSASADVARRFHRALGVRLSVFGHDVIRTGYEKVGDEQIIVSTSFGLYDRDKVYLDLDLAASYQTVHDLREGEEIRKVWPDATGDSAIERSA